MNDPYDVLKDVKDEISLISFLESLKKDWQEGLNREELNKSSTFGTSPKGWENGSIGQFLEAAIAYAKDTSKETNNNPWQRMAQIVYAGKIYE